MSAKKAYKRAAVEAAFDAMGLPSLDVWLRYYSASCTNADLAGSLHTMTGVRVSGECVRLWTKKLPADES